MTALLLDTTVLIDVERTRIRLDGIIADDDTVAIAAVTAAELLVGVHLASEARRTRRQDYVDAVLQTVPVLAYDIEVAAIHAELLAETRRLGRPRGAHDLIIAATARASNRTVVTADPDGFEALSGITVVAYR